MFMTQNEKTKELFEQAKVDFKALDTLLKLVSEAKETFEKSKQNLHNNLSWMFQDAMDKNPGLLILQSRCMLAMLDEPAEQAFVEDLIEAIIQEGVDESPDHKTPSSSTFFIEEESMKKIDLDAFRSLLEKIRKHIPVEVVVDEKKCKITVHRI